MTRPIFIPPTLFALSVFTFLPASAFAQSAGDTQCASDADCPSGGTCQKAQWTDGCAPSANGEMTPCDTTVHEAELGTCYVPPPQCAGDADCGEYTSCQSAGSTGACAVDSTGAVTCDTPTMESPKYCAPDYGGDCETESDCPREFACIEIAQPCPDIACAPDQPDCSSGCAGTSKMCEPKQIVCETSDQCPSDWSCLRMTKATCSGGGGTATPEKGEPPIATDPATDPSIDGGTSMGGTAPSTPDAGAPDAAAGGTSSADPLPPDMIPPDTCEPAATTGYCYPDAWQSSFGISAESTSGGDTSSDKGTGTAAGEGSADPGAGPVPSPTSPTGAGPMDADMPTTHGGCSASPAAPASGASWLLLLLGLSPLLRRRRQA